MAKKGGSRHEKTLAASRIRKIKRKETVWTVKSRPGPHSSENSLPLLLLLRDYLKFAKNYREAESIIKSKEVLVDQRVVTDAKFPLGFMDVISIPKLDEYYRIVLDKRGRIDLQELKKEETNFKLCRIETKTSVSKESIQLTLHDGRNILIKDGKYKVGDVLKISLPDQKILEHYELKKGSSVYITGGKHSGDVVEVSDIQRGSMTREILIFFKKDHGVYSTPLKYVFVLGKGEHLIRLT